MTAKTPITVFLAAIAAAAFADKPNVLIIYTDDHGSVDAGCYGSPDLVTPNIDRLAAAGVRFTQMLAPSAICSASRAGLLTGKIPMRAGVPGNVSSSHGEAGLSPKNYTLAEMLSDSGYRTHHVGKWHLGYDEATMPLGHGFRTSFGHMGGCIDNYSHFFYWQGPNRHDLWRDGEEVWADGRNFGEMMVEEVKTVIDSEDDEPFFVYWAFNWPHYPLQGFDKWRQFYADKGLESPRDKYCAFVSSMDELIGQALDHLEKSGKADNTIVILQSDHGHSVEERTFSGGGDPGPYRGHKGSFFEGGIRVPSIVSWPAELPKGAVRDQLVVGCDWYPTLAEWCGEKAPDDIDGVSISKIVESAEAPSPHESWYWTFGARKDKQGADLGHWAVRQGDWKLIGNPKDLRNPDSLTANDKKLFLANLAEDIGETKNLAKERPEILRQLLQLHETYQAGLLADFEALKQP